PTPENLSEAMTELLDRELDEPALIVGNSLGGAVALRYALASPARVRGVFLASPAGAAMGPDDHAAFMRLFDFGSRAHARAFLVRVYHGEPWFLPIFTREVRRLFARPSVRSLTRSIRPEHSFTKAELGSLAMPIHLLWGREELLMPARHLAFFKANLPAHA